MSRNPTASPEQVRQIRANIYPPAHTAIADWSTFPWHRNSAGVPYTHLPQSSQAFCISIWGTLARPDARKARAAVAGLLADWQVSDAFDEPPELRLEFIDRDLLNEKGAGIPTNVDAFLLYPGLALIVESKLTERFGSCSQVSRRHCTGRYEIGSDLKTLTPALCRLEIKDGLRTPRRYWEVMRALSGPDEYQPGKLCPFAGPGYQVMRNITFASEFAARHDADWRVVFAFPESLSPKSRGDVAEVTARLRPENRRRVLQLNYEELAVLLEGTGDPVAAGLSAYMSTRLGGLRPRNWPR